MNSSINLLDVCVLSYDLIYSHSIDQLVPDLISKKEINLYFQIQKLKVWSYILLQYNENHAHFRKFYSWRSSSVCLNHFQCRSCHADLQCSCFFLRDLVQKIVTFTRNICVNLNEQTKELLNIFTEDDVDSICQQRTLKRRQGNIFISSGIQSLINQNLFYLQHQDPIQWDDEDLQILLKIIKLEDHLERLEYFQMDGFCLLFFINTPFMELNNKMTKLIGENNKKANYSQLNTNNFVGLLYLLNFIAVQIIQRNHQDHKGSKDKKQQKRQISFFNSSQNFSFYQIERKPTAIVSLSRTKEKKMTRTTNVFQSKEELNQYFNPDFQNYLIKYQEIQKSNSEEQFMKSQSTSSEEYLKESKNQNMNELVLFYEEDPSKHQSTQISDPKELKFIQEFGNPTQGQQYQGAQYLNNNRDELQQSELITDIKEQFQQSTLLNDINAQIVPENQLQQSELIDLPEPPQLVFQSSALITDINQQPENEQKQLFEQSTIINDINQENNYALQQSYLITQLDLKTTNNNQQVKNQQANSQQQSQQTLDNYFNTVVISSNQKKKKRVKVSQRIENLKQVEQESLSAQFNPFNPITNIFMKLSYSNGFICKSPIIQMEGSTFGRVIENTFSFVDNEKISSQHARIRFKDDKFYLQDLGSKQGTFLKIGKGFQLVKDQQIYSGYKKLFQVCEINSNAISGELTILYEKEQKIHKKNIQLRVGEAFSIGRDPQKNKESFLRCEQAIYLLFTSCNKLLSERHLEIIYDSSVGKKSDNSAHFYINDLDSRNGTWLRLSKRQEKSEFFELKQSQFFNLAFQIDFQVQEMSTQI